MAHKSSFLGYLFKFILLLIGIAIVAPIAFVLLINPNHYKSDIQQYLSEKTGYEIQLNGDISLQWFPWIGLRVEDIKVASPFKDTPDLFSAKEIQLKLPINKLLAWEFRLDSLSIEEGKFYLVKEKNGRANWDVGVDKSEKIEKQSQVKDTAQNADHGRAPSMYFSISLLTVKNGTVDYIDKQNNQAIKLNRVTFLAEDFGQALRYPLKGEFDFSLSDLKTQKAIYQGQASMSGKLPKPSNDLIRVEDFKTDIKWQDRRSNQTHHLSAALELKIQAQKTLHIDKLNAQLDGTQLTGKITYPLNQQAIQYDLNIDKLNLHQWIKAEQEGTNAAVLPTRYTPVSFTQTAQQPSTTVSLPDSKGTLKIKQLNYQNLAVSNVQLNNTIKNNVLTIDPLIAHLHEGKINAVVTKNLNGNHPLYFKGSAQQLNMQSLLKTAANVDQLKGSGDLNFTYAYLNNNLSGTTHVKITNGAIIGLDLDYYFQMAENFIKKQPTAPARSNAVTPFNSLTATLLLNQHRLSNEDLVMLNNDYRVTGRGYILLNQETIDYDILANRIYRDGKEHPNALPLAVSIKGPLKNPQIVPDMDHYMKLILEREAKKQIEKNLNKQIGKILGQEGTEEKPAEQIEQKIEKEIEKGLKKLFKF